MNAQVTMSEKRQARLVEELTLEVEMLTNRIGKFAAELVAQPAYALSWSSDAFRDAAKLELYSQLLAKLEDGATIQQVADQMLRDVVRGARDPQRSTSPVSNVMEQERLSARAEMLERLIS